MTAPIDDLTKNFLDAASDDPSQARAEIESLLDKTKEVLAFLPHRGALVYNALNQNIGGALAFNTEVYDTDSIHDSATNNTRLTVPAGVDRVRLTATLECSASASAWLFSRILKNGAPVIGMPGLKTMPIGSVNNMHCLASPVVNVVGGDYFELAMFSSGSSETVYGGASFMTFFAMEIIE